MDGFIVNHGGKEVDDFEAGKQRNTKTVCKWIQARKQHSISMGRTNIDHHYSLSAQHTLPTFLTVMVRSTR